MTLQEWFFGDPVPKMLKCFALAKYLDLSNVKGVQSKFNLNVFETH